MSDDQVVQLNFALSVLKDPYAFMAYCEQNRKHVFAVGQTSPLNMWLAHHGVTLVRVTHAFLARKQWILHVGNTPNVYLLPTWVQHMHQTINARHRECITGERCLQAMQWRAAA